MHPVVELDGQIIHVDLPPPSANPASIAAPIIAAPANSSAVSAPHLDTATEPADIEVPLLQLAWARSGDKGNTSNIGIIARRPEWLPLLRARLTEEHLAQWLAHLVKGRVVRYDVPGIHALNFVCEQALDGGGMASLRNDALGKGMAQIVLTMPVPVSARWWAAQQDR